MTTKTETTHAFGFVISEANGNRSRENGTLASGQNLPAGAILKVSGENYTEVADGDESSAVAILGAAVDATDGALPCVVIARDAEVNGAELVYNDGSPAVDTDDINDALADVGIIVR